MDSKLLESQQLHTAHLQVKNFSIEVAISDNLNVDIAKVYADCLPR